MTQITDKKYYQSTETWHNRITQKSENISNNPSLSAKERCTKTIKQATVTKKPQSLGNQGLQPSFKKSFAPQAKKLATVPAKRVAVANTVLNGQVNNAAKKPLLAPKIPRTLAAPLQVKKPATLPAKRVAVANTVLNSQVNNAAKNPLLAPKTPRTLAAPPQAKKLAAVPAKALSAAPKVVKRQTISTLSLSAQKDLLKNTVERNPYTKEIFNKFNGDFHKLSKTVTTLYSDQTLPQHRNLLDSQAVACLQKSHVYPAVKVFRDNKEFALVRYSEKLTDENGDALEGGSKEAFAALQIEIEKKGSTIICKEAKVLAELQIKNYVNYREKIGKNYPLIFSHPHILDPKWVISNQDLTTASLYFPFCNQFDLFSAAPQIPFIGKMKVLEDATGGLNHLHQSGWIHRDVKPENIGVQYNGAWHGYIIDTDDVISVEDAASCTKVVGTTSLLPLKEQQAFKDGISFTPSQALDLYAFGLVVHETVNRNCAKDPKSGLAKIRNDIVWINKEIVGPLTSEDANQRPALAKIEGTFSKIAESYTKKK